MATERFTIPGNGFMRYSGRHNSIAVIEASAAFKARFFGTDSRIREYELVQGQSITGEPFDVLELEALGADPVAVGLTMLDGALEGAGAVRSIAMGTAAPVTAAHVVGTVAVEVLAANGSRRSAAIRNAGGATVYIGGPGVTVATGWPLEPGEGWSTDTSAAAWYAIAAAAGQAVRTIEEA